MSFWENLGEVIGKAIVENKKTYESASVSSERKTDEKLIKDFKAETNMAKKLAMANELKKRGYGNQD